MAQSLLPADGEEDPGEILKYIRRSKAKWEFVKHLLATSSIFTLAAVVGLGYLIGKVNVFGFRFGVAGVLFAGLAIGAMGVGQCCRFG